MGKGCTIFGGGGSGSYNKIFAEKGGGGGVVWKYFKNGEGV